MLTKRLCLLFFLLISFQQIFAQDDLENYINRLKQSQASGGSETAFLSAGSSFLYGQGYFEKKQYDLAAMYFKEALGKEPNNAFFNYQMAIALIRQKDKYKTEEAQSFLQKAFELNQNLKTTYNKEQAATNISEVANTQNNKEKNAPVKREGLEAYLEALKYSRANGDSKTAMNAPGRDVMYGYEYYEQGEFASAATNFRYAVSKDADDIYANYLLGVSLTAQGKSSEATQFLAKAFAGDKGLRDRFEKDAANSSAIFKKKEAAKIPVTTPAPKRITGGALVYGDYNCSETVWNGPNQSPAYRYISKGYFQLKDDGTYRWLDNGVTGKYTYDAKTGSIKFLSGHLAPTVKTAQFQPGEKVAQITLNFSESYRWECGCNK